MISLTGPSARGAMARMASDRETMNRDRVELWLAGLEGERFQQCRYLLETHLNDGTQVNCAAGVGIRVFCEQTNRAFEIDHLVHLLAQAAAWYQVKVMDLVLTSSEEEGTYVTVTMLNDIVEESLTQIAQRIRKDYF